MLKIFAIDPKICGKLDWFKYCTEHCRPSQGRVMVDLPNGQWYRNAEQIIDQLAQDLKLKPVKRRGLKERLKSVQAQLVDRPGTAWTNWYDDDFSQFSWLTETRMEHQREPFSLVVSPDCDGVDMQKQECHPDDLDRTVSAWNTPSGVSITRSPGEFVTAILPMLRLAANIHCIDRYFSVDHDSSHTQNYKRIIEDLASYYDKFPSLTIHCCPDTDRMPDKNYFKNELSKHYAPLIPRGKSMAVFFWQVEEQAQTERGAHPFHNRFVLSNHCGVSVGYGTDSAKQQTQAPDLLQIIDHEIYRNLWNQIRDETFPMLYIEHKFEIKGTA